MNGSYSFLHKAIIQEARAKGLAHLGQATVIEAGVSAGLRKALLEDFRERSPLHAEGWLRFFPEASPEAHWVINYIRLEGSEEPEVFNVTYD